MRDPFNRETSHLSRISETQFFFDDRFRSSDSLGDPLFHHSGKTLCGPDHRLEKLCNEMQSERNSDA